MGTKFVLGGLRCGGTRSAQPGLSTSAGDRSKHISHTGHSHVRPVGEIRAKGHARTAFLQLLWGFSKNCFQDLAKDILLTSCPTMYVKVGIFLSEVTDSWQHLQCLSPS